MAAILAVIIMTSATASTARPASAAQERDPEIVAALEMINTYRSWLGIPPLTIDPALQRAAEAHAEYYRLNYGDPSLAGMGLHNQTEGRPGFTGRTFQDRARAAGYSGSVNENAGLSGSMVWSTEWFIGTIGHRLTLLDPRYVHIGLAAVNQGNIKFEIIDLGAPRWFDETTPEWIAWPPAGSTGVGLRFDGEAPDPYGGVSYPVGYPITLKYFGPGDLTLTRAAISSGGQPVPSFAEVGSGWLSRETIQLSAQRPLEPGRTYDVRIDGTANGQPFTRSWSFTTTTGQDELAWSGQTGVAPPAGVAPPGPEPAPVDLMPVGLKGAQPIIQNLWWETDGPIHQEAVERSWLWGPDTWLDIQEDSRESSNGMRQVYYFDKARMEVNEPEGEDDYVTAGLLVRDMIVGRIQIGENEYREFYPASVPLAGDEKRVNGDAPTYASLTGIASVQPGREVAARPGQGIGEVLSADGSISDDRSLAALATYGSYEPTLGHNIASVFDTYLATLATDWKMSVGLPLSEPYWVRTNLKGEATWVLVQVFERRVLTYTPVNRPEWRVEMGNVGRAYYEWRYGVVPPDTESR